MTPQLNLDVSELKLNDESVSLIVHSLALECHEAALAGGLFSESVEGQLGLVGSVIDSHGCDLLDISSVFTGGTPCIASISFGFSNERYLLLAEAAKDRVARAIDGDANIVGIGHE